jgi:hypothetical protein
MHLQITKHFSYREMTRSATGQRLGLKNDPPPELMPNILKVCERLEKVREHFGKPVTVLSCYRAPAVNAAVGGSKTSAHRFGLAADFEVEGVANIDVARWCAEHINDFDQIIYEFGPSGWVHMGFTDTKEPRKQLLSAVKDGGKTVYKPGLVE